MSESDLFIHWMEFHDEQLFGKDNCKQGFAYRLALKCIEPIVGPICFGYGYHFGLGLFVPAQGERQ